MNVARTSSQNSISSEVFTVRMQQSQIVKFASPMDVLTTSKQMFGTGSPHGRVLGICFEGVHVHICPCSCSETLQYEPTLTIMSGGAGEGSWTSQSRFVRASGGHSRKS
jgi:hypothetical protein